MMKKQRNIDIQLLRAAAIIAVLGFHLRPEYVPQGFLGVDIFFAISGYLMTVILFDQPLTVKTCLVFYERRLKRLLPAYILCIFATFVISSFFVIKTYSEFLKTDTLWAMTFGTNLQSMFEKETYFKLINDYKFLLHTWSLSVEIQYYVLAPIILIPISWCSNPLLPLLALSGLSWIFQTFIPYPTISFGLVFSRFWQFLIGSIVFYTGWPKKKCNSIFKQMEKDLNNLCWVGLILDVEAHLTLQYDLFNIFVSGVSPPPSFEKYVFRPFRRTKFLGEPEGLEKM